MRTSKFREEQLIAILKEAEAGMKTDDVCRRHGISRQTFYRGRSKYGGLEVSEARRLKKLEEENRRLKQLRTNVKSPEPPQTPVQKRATHLLRVGRGLENFGQDARGDGVALAA